MPDIGDEIGERQNPTYTEVLALQSDAQVRVRVAGDLYGFGFKPPCASLHLGEMKVLSLTGGMPRAINVTGWHEERACAERLPRPSPKRRTAKRMTGAQQVRAFGSPVSPNQPDLERRLQALRATQIEQSAELTR